MRVMILSSLLAISSAVWAASASGPKVKPCTVTADMLSVYRDPAGASDQEWRAARNMALDLMVSECRATGPRRGPERAAVFELLEREMLVDYADVFAAREKRTGKPLSESAAEGPMYFQRDLSEFIDRIVTPEDIQYKEVILRYGGGLAISKLGKAVRSAVFRQAAEPARSFYGVEMRSPQVEAIRAIGYWLDPASPVLTAAERKEWAQVLATLLPNDGILLDAEHHPRLVRTALEALSRSDSTEAEQTIRTWRNVYQNNYGRGDSLEILAQEAADKIRSRNRKR